MIWPYSEIEGCGDEDGSVLSVALLVGRIDR